MTDPHNPFQSIIGAELSSVEFVRDYLQFRFDGPCLNVITDPYIIINGKRYNRSDGEFCNQLLTLIGVIVTGATVTLNEAIRIHFRGGGSIHISLKPEDYQTAEAATFQIDSGEFWVW